MNCDLHSLSSALLKSGYANCLQKKLCVAYSDMTPKSQNLSTTKISQRRPLLGIVTLTMATDMPFTVGEPLESVLACWSTTRQDTESLQNIKSRYCLKAPRAIRH
jgi:hypothetical protein